MGSVPGLRRSPGGGNGNPLEYPCLGNPMDRGVWRAAVPGVSRVRHGLATKPPPLKIKGLSHHSWLYRSVLSSLLSGRCGFSILPFLQTVTLVNSQGLSASFCGNDRVEQMTKGLFSFSHSEVLWS